MHIEYRVFMYNVMCIHLDNIPKKLNIYPLVRIFYNKEELNETIIENRIFQFWQICKSEYAQVSKDAVHDI